MHHQAAHLQAAHLGIDLITISSDDRSSETDANDCDQRHRYRRKGKQESKTPYDGAQAVNHHRAGMDSPVRLCWRLMSNQPAPAVSDEGLNGFVLKWPSANCALRHSLDESIWIKFQMMNEVPCNAATRQIIARNTERDFSGSELRYQFHSTRRPWLWSRHYRPKLPSAMIAKGTCCSCTDQFFVHRGWPPDDLGSRAPFDWHGHPAVDFCWNRSGGS